MSHGFTTAEARRSCPVVPGVAVIRKLATLRGTKETWKSLSHYRLPLIDSTASGLGTKSRRPIGNPGVWLDSGAEGRSFRML